MTRRRIPEGTDLMGAAKARRLTQPDVGAMLFCTPCRVVYNPARQDHSDHEEVDHGEDTDQ